MLVGQLLTVCTCIAILLSVSKASAQTNLSPQARDTVSDGPSVDQAKDREGASGTSSTAETMKSDTAAPQQTTRILGIIPNYRSVNANTHLAPLSSKKKLWLATEDSFDYSSFAYVGILTGITMAENPQRSFGDGAESLGQYYAHNFADTAIENFMVEAFVPTATKEDPRYYTLGHGGFFKRSGYALSRLLVTRTNSGSSTLNLSEIIGAGTAAGISNAYYPPRPNPFVQTYQLWISEIAQDGLSNIAKEFWPDINRAIFHGKY